MRAARLVDICIQGRFGHLPPGDDEGVGRGGDDAFVTVCPVGLHRPASLLERLAHPDDVGVMGEAEPVEVEPNKRDRDDGRDFQLAIEESPAGSA